MSNAATTPEPPYLPCVGDVPVEAPYHGPALLYRLLQTYSPDRLAIIDGAIEVSNLERRLAEVPFYAALMSMPRLQTTRFADWRYGMLSMAWFSPLSKYRKGIADPIKH